MKASELMIGDWLYYSHTEDGIAPYKEVICIKAEDLCCDACIIETHYESIPLTPEILEKNGFDVLSHENPAAFAYKKEEVSIVEVYWNGPERGYRCIFSYGDTRLRITCHFVHEFQHALRICGIEKEIEL